MKSIVVSLVSSLLMTMLVLPVLPVRVRAPTSPIEWKTTADFDAGTKSLTTGSQAGNYAVETEMDNPLIALEGTPALRVLTGSGDTFTVTDIDARTWKWLWSDVAACNRTYYSASKVDAMIAGGHWNHLLGAMNFTVLQNGTHVEDVSRWTGTIGSDSTGIILADRIQRTVGGQFAFGLTQDPVGRCEGPFTSSWNTNPSYATWIQANETATGVTWSAFWMDGTAPYHQCGSSFVTAGTVPSHHNLYVSRSGQTYTIYLDTANLGVCSIPYTGYVYQQLWTVVPMTASPGAEFISWSDEAGVGNIGYPRGAHGSPGVVTATWTTPSFLTGATDYLNVTGTAYQVDVLAPRPLLHDMSNNWYIAAVTVYNATGVQKGTAGPFKTGHTIILPSTSITLPIVCPCTVKVSFQVWAQDGYSSTSVEMHYLAAFFVPAPPPPPPPPADWSSLTKFLGVCGVWVAIALFGIYAILKGAYWIRRNRPGGA